MAKAKEKEQAALPPLVITPEKGMPVDGNFPQILEYLKRRAKEVAKMNLSEDNLEQAKLVKKEAGAYRKAVEERVKTTIALLFDGPKDVLKSKAQELYNAIGLLESSAEKVIGEVEENRVADLNRAYELYKEEFQALYALSDKSLAAIEFPKWYYNKTPPGNEKKAKDDLEQQFKDRKRAQDDHEASVGMIRSMCADEPRLNVQGWLDRFEITSSMALVAQEIVAEKERLAELDRPVAEPEDEEADEVEAAGFAPVAARAPTLRIGVPESIVSFQTDFPGRTLKKRIELEYPCDMGDQITELFKELRRSGVVARVLKEEAVF
jgi:hypothetical protein